MIRDVDSGNIFIRESVEYERGGRRVFATSRFEASDAKKNSFILICSGGEESGGLWVANVLLLFHIGARGSNESR